MHSLVLSIMLAVLQVSNFALCVNSATKISAVVDVYGRHPQ